MIWTALVISIGFLVATLALAAIDAVTRGWYALGAIVYGAAFLVAIIAWLARPDAKAEAPAARPARGTIAPRPVVRSELRERVLYSTPHGQVVERSERGPARASHGFVVERDAGATQAKDVEQVLQAAAARPAGEPPTPAQVDLALRRWGRVHEVS